MINTLSKLLLIKNGEQQQVLYFSALFFFIGAGMAIGRGASETLFFKRFGIEYLPLMYIVSSIILCVVSLLYAAFVDRLSSEKFYKILFSILAILLLFNWYISHFLDSDLIYPAFFLLYEVASELLLVHCAVYLTQNLVQTQSKRLTPLILSGFQIGVITGGILLAVVSPYVGVENMILLWVALLLGSFITLSRWHTKNGISPYFRPGKKSRSGLSQSFEQISQGLKLVQSSKLLRMSSLSLFFMVISVYILAFSINTVYTQHFTSEESLSSFFGLLTAFTGTIALLIQLLFTNRFIRRFGIKKVNYIFPVTSIFSYSALLIGFTLPSAIIGSFNKETLMPAFAKPVRNIFNATLPEKSQGRAQAVAVVAVIPLGLACAGIFLLFTDSQNNINNFLLAGLLSSITLLYFNRKMNAAYAKEILSNLKNRLYLPEQQQKDNGEDNTGHLMSDYSFDDIKKGILSSDDDLSLYYMDILLKTTPEISLSTLIIRLQSANTVYKDKVIKKLQYQKALKLTNPSDLDLINNIMGTGDKHLDATLLKVIFQAKLNNNKALLLNLLNENNPRLVSLGIYGVFNHKDTSLYELSYKKWMQMIDSPETKNYIPAIELITPDFKVFYQQPQLLTKLKNKLSNMLLDKSIKQKITAIKILAFWKKDEINDIQIPINDLVSDDNWQVRLNCLKLFSLLEQDIIITLLKKLISDKHPNVRKNALYLLTSYQGDDIEYIQNLLMQNNHTPRTVRTMIEYLLHEGGNPNTLHNISIFLARKAVDLHQASQYLKTSNIPKNTGTTILSCALTERTLETAELALYATQVSDRDSEIAVIRAGLKSSDKRQFSNACELLSMLNNKQLSSLILPIFDDHHSLKNIKHKKQQFDNLESILQWLLQSSDSWLKECANYCSTKLKDKQHA